MDSEEIVKLFETTPYDFRWARKEEWKPAMLLAWKTFMKFEACDYTDEGKKAFFEFISDDDIYRAFLNGTYKLMVALDGDKIIGIGSLRNVNILSLLFVDEEYHKQGVGSILLELLGSFVRDEQGENKLYVKAAPYAVHFYENSGFMSFQKEIEHDGIRVTPMVKNL